MSGTKPDFTTTEVAYNNAWDRQVNRLMHWTVVDGFQVTTADGLIRLEFPNVTATASGLAQWFVLRAYSTPQPVHSNTDTSQYNFLFTLMGNIGTPGTGHDLIIGSAAVTAGLPYNVGPIYIKFPQTYTY